MINPMLLLCEKQREPCVPKDTTDWPVPKRDFPAASAVGSQHHTEIASGEQGPHTFGV